MRILAVDLGERRVGLAICDEEQILASPLDFRNVRSLDDAEAAVRSAVSETGAGRIVLGAPRHMSGRPSPGLKNAEAFAQRLREQGLEVVLWDERLSTAGAERALRDDVGLSRKQRKGRLDAVAAQIILSSYLDHLRRHPPLASDE